MPTLFTQAPATTEWPNDPIQQVAQTLATFFPRRNPAEWRDVRDLFASHIGYDDAQELLDDSLNEPVSRECRAFLEAVQHLHDGFKNRKGKWTEVLGTVAEEAIRHLLAAKYGAAGQPHLKPESCPHLYDCALPPPRGVQPVATMNKKPMDAICWDEDRDWGEMHEVKRTIVNFDDAAKLRLMRTFKLAAEAQSGRPVWFGVAGFFDPVTRAEERLRTLLGLFATEEPLILDVLVPDTYEQWLNNPYL